MGNSAQALKAYLAAASAPYQESRAPREAYDRLFQAQKLGTNQDAEQRILAEAAGTARRTAAQYTPVAINRPAPKFTFADLVGKRFDNQKASLPSLLSGLFGVPPASRNYPPYRSFRNSTLTGTCWLWR
jgi:hypothetical protein